MIKEITLKTSGMTCNSCEGMISNALMKLEGISDVKANFSDETTKITYDETKVDLIKIRETIEGVGYGFENQNTVNKKSINRYNILNNFLILLHLRNKGGCRNNSGDFPGYLRTEYPEHIFIL